MKTIGAAELNVSETRSAINSLVKSYGTMQSHQTL